MTSALVSNTGLMAAGPLFDATKKLQRIGENAFTAALLISALQAGVALYQYRSNPGGELIVPPGLTWGVENPYDPSNLVQRDRLVADEAEPSASKQVSAAKLTNGEDSITEAHESMWKRPLSRLNRWLLLLLPWMSHQVNFFMKRNVHLLHIGFVMSLATLFGIQRPRFRSLDQDAAALWKLDAHEDGGGRENQKVVVIGDSLAVGIGCCNKYDVNKNINTPMVRLEVLSRDSTGEKEKGEEEEEVASPVFPQVLARTLSERLQSRVFWRSAGVDGGSVEDIEHYCLGVVEEETSKGHAPDFLVVLCGMNDLKTFVGNPFQASSATAYQRKLMDLIEHVQHIAPNCKVVLPALPIQMFHRNSILNILPLALFLDTIVGFWDSQKKRVANHLPSNVLYVGISASDIYEWYKKNDDTENEEDITLIAADGVHPNRRCYSKWAETVANRLADKLELL